MTSKKITQDNIADASTADIRKFALDEAGLDFADDAGREYMIYEIYEALEWDAYNPKDGATHVEITLAKTPEHKHPYRGGARNATGGGMFTIKRGEPVVINIMQYNSMLEAAKMAYAIESLSGDDPEISEGGSAHKRIPLGDLPITVHRWINKGTQKSEAASS